MVAGNLDWGARWDNKRKQVTYNCTNIVADLDAKRSKEEVTMQVLREAASSVTEFLEFTSEVSGGSGSPLPVLDTQLWIETPPQHQEAWYGHEAEGQVVPGTKRRGETPQIMYKFYSKPVSSKMTILRRSAMPEGLKVATSAQEILRRLKTTSEITSKETSEGILREYMDNLTGMGYPKQWRSKVLRSTLVGYMKLLKRVEEGETKRNRMGKETQLSRRFKKLLGNQYWYRVEDKEQEMDELEGTLGRRMTLGPKAKSRTEPKYVESVVFISHTPQTELKGRLTRVEQSLGFKTRFNYIERLGRTLGQLLVQKDPIAMDCGRQGCMAC